MRKSNLAILLIVTVLFSCSSIPKQTQRSLELGSALTMGNLVRANMLAIGYLYKQGLITDSERKIASEQSIKAGEALEFIANNPDNPLNDERLDEIRVASEAILSLMDSAVKR